MPNKTKSNFLITIFILSLLLSVICQPLSAQTTMKSKIDDIIKTNPLSNTSLIAVSVRDVSTGKLIYQRYGNYLLHTASTLKAFSTPLALEYLGKSNYLSTGVYKSGTGGDIYLKLSGDPVLTYKDLLKLMNDAKANGLSSINGDIIIDDSATDNIPWGTGWMWDDENNQLMPKYSSYNLDHNVITVTVSPQGSNQPPKVSLSPYYPVKIINNALTTKVHSIKIERCSWKDPEAIYVSGTINQTVRKKIPVGIPSHYFISRFKESMSASGISFKGHIKTGLLPLNSLLIADIKHNVFDIASYTNRKSDNLAAETLLKLAGANYTGKEGSTENGLKAFKAFYTKIGAPIDRQEIVDGSGASHNDLVQPDWMTLALSKLYNYPHYLNILVQPGKEGTLQNRLTCYANRLWAKTGTLSGISGITGYLKGNSGKTYACAILIQNYKGSSMPAKNLENQILQVIGTF